MLRRNLFADHDDVGAAYRALLEHQESDRKKGKWAGRGGAATIGAGATLYQYHPWLGCVLAALGLSLLWVGMEIFIDMSNRNFMLLLIEYAEWREPSKKRDLPIGRDTY